MSYLKRKSEVFKRSKKLMAILLSGIGLWITGTFILTYYFKSTNITFGYGLFVFGVLWFFIRMVQSPLLCSKCDFHLEDIVITLGKEAEKGFCPKCGNRIA